MPIAKRETIKLIAQSEAPIAKAFADTRRKNMGSVVPADMARRNDFVLLTEFN